jgi:hypothetical protein
MVWLIFDEQLFNLKHAELAPELHKKTQAATSRARFERRRLGQGMTAGFYAAVVDAQIEVLREHLKDIDRICREVWRRQGGIETPHFVRAVIRDKVFSVIAARFGSIKWEIELEAKRTRFGELGPVLGHIAREKAQLESIVSKRYEIEARELELQAKQETAKVAEAPHISQAVSVGSNVSRWHAGDVVSSVADLWRDFRAEFQSLADEERKEGAARRDRFVRAYCTYQEHPEVPAVRKDARLAFALSYSANDDHAGVPKVIETVPTEFGPFCLLKTPESGLWMLSEGVNENFQERFQTLATRAGVALDSPKGTEPLDFWLHRLFLDLRENGSDLLLIDEKGEAGLIHRVCEGSAIFCSRLERKSLEAPLMLPQQDAKRGKPERQRTRVAKRRVPGGAKPNVWTKLERRGDLIVLGEPSNDTATQMRHDYDLLYWSVRQFNQWASQKTENEKQPTLEEARAVFGGTILVGDASRVPYLTDQELEALITHRQTPSSFAESIVTKRWGFTSATGRTYLRRKRNRTSVRRADL